MDEGSARAPVHHRIGFRHGQNGLDGDPDLFEEFLSEPLTLPVVPAVRAFKILRSRRPKNVVLHRERDRT